MSGRGLLIVPNDLIGDTETTLSASSSEPKFPVARLKAHQPSYGWRTTTIAGTPWVEADLGDRAVDWDTVALIGYRGAQSRNLLRAADDLDITQGWTHTNFTFSETQGVFVAEIDKGVRFHRWSATATNPVFADFAFTSVPGDGGSLGIATGFELTAQVLIRKEGSSDLDVVLEIFDGAGGSARVTLDTSAVTSGGASAAGGFSVDSHSATLLSAAVVRFSMSITTSTDADLTFRLRLQTAAGSTTVPAGSIMRVGAPVVSITQSGAAGVTKEVYETAAIEYPVTEHHGSAPHVRFLYGSNTDPSFSLQQSGWRPISMRNQLHDWPVYNHYWRLTELPVVGQEPPVSEQFVRTEFFDPDNQAGVIELGRWIVGRAHELGDFVQAFELGADEAGETIASDGGQEYDPQNPVRRVMRFELHFVSQRTAYDVLHYMQRQLGRSRPFLAIAPEVLDASCNGETTTEPAWAQERMIYGKMSRLDPMPIQSGRIPYRWRFGFTVRESL